MKTGLFLRGALLLALPLVGALGLLSACGSSDDNTGGSAGAAPTGVANGALVAKTHVCASCHAEDYGGAGYYPNITNDTATGIGSWTDAEVKAAIRDGKDKDGSDLCSLMAHYSSDEISDSDLTDLVAYLRSLSVSRDITQECPDK